MRDLESMCAEGLVFYTTLFFFYWTLSRYVSYRPPARMYYVRTFAATMNATTNFTTRTTTYAKAVPTPSPAT